MGSIRELSPELAEPVFQDQSARLICESAQGCQLSFRQLVELSRNRLLAIVMRVNANLAQAEEVLQEIYLKVWQEADSFCPEKAAGNAWLAKIARNAAIDSVRRNDCRPVFEMVDDESDLDRYESFSSPLPGPLQILMALRRMQSLGESLDGLSAEHRVVLYLSFFDEQTHPEIAEILGKPLGSVKSLIRRGLISLQSTVSYEFC